MKIELEITKKSKLKAALINLDLQKAFDSVWHNGLLFKLWIAGIRGPLFKILQTFLKNRLVRTRLEGRLRVQVQPKQSVPQGSVLSQLLFIFYIAEMLTNTTGIKFKYADDSQILVSAPVESALHRILQRNLSIVEKWCSTWRIQINGSKTEILHINSDGLATSVFTLGNETCKIKNKTKTFGLIVDNACSFKDHTELVVARCKNKWRELRIHCTNRWGLSRNTLTTLYKTLILPTLLYCAPVWSNQNAAKLQPFNAFVNRSILQTRFNPNERGAEAVLGTPTIDIVCQNISAKFLTKVLQQRDLLSELFIKNEGTVTFVTFHRNVLKTFYKKKNFDLTDPLSYTEAISRNHTLRQWNSRWRYPDFETNLKKIVPRVDTVPALIKLSLHKELMRTAIEVLLDINPFLKNFAYNRSLTTSPMCSCRIIEETATDFLFDCQNLVTRNLSTGNFNLYDKNNCINLGGRKWVEGTRSKIRVSPQVDVPNF